MKKIIVFAFVTITSGVLLSGCGSAPRRIDPAGNQSLTTTDEVNVKDWQIVAEKCINQILQTGELDNPGHPGKAIIMIGIIKNNTSRHLDTNILTNQVRAALLRSGKAVTTTAVSGRGAEDRSTRQVRDLRDDEMFNQQTVKKMGTAIAPDFSLAGEIIQNRTAQGRMRESAFYFHVTLTNLNTGLAVYDAQIPIVKQSEKALFGF